MGLFDRMRQAQPLANDVEVGGSPDMSSPEMPAADLLDRALSTAAEAVEVHWRFLVETTLIGLGALALSVLFIWATVTGRVSVETIIVIIVVLGLSLFTLSQGMRYHTRNRSLQERARLSVAKTTLAAEIMMDFLREFTLKNQQTISQLAESHKVRVSEELRQSIEDLGRSMGDERWRRELIQLAEAIERKIMEIPTGVALPLPRLEYFDQALRHLQEPERTPKCPACGAPQAQLSKIDGGEGLRYTCTHCGHEFSVGIRIRLEKNS
jgi:hypothetical protein